ncbi:Ubiquitin-conjugating enzyme variant Kua [Balamuthia mandrillaris]
MTRPVGTVTSPSSSSSATLLTSKEEEALNAPPMAAATAATTAKGKEKVSSSCGSLTNDFKDRTQKRKRNAAFLASHYSAGKQRLDKVVAACYLLFFAKLSYHLLLTMNSLNNVLTFLIAAPFAALLADFASGMLHWACDTWGYLDTPLVGKNLIRSFREHHVDPTAITRHPFFETNGNSLLVTIPVVILLSLNPPSNPSGQFDLYFSFKSFLAVFTLLISFTNQFHKWAHTHRPPWLVRQLQNYHLILRPQCHQKHHFSPYDRDYCITTGWLNPFLQAIGFWQRLEALVSWLTGAKPREDDYLWTRLTTHTDSQDHKYAASLAALSHSSPSCFSSSSS